MEEILDNDPKENQVDEAKINKLTALLRYIVAAFLFGLEFREVFREANFILGNYNRETKAGFHFYLISLLFVGYFIFYNLRQAKYERQVNYFYSEFNSWATIVYLLYTGGLIWVYGNQFLLIYRFVGINFKAFSFMVISIMLLFLFYREVTYIFRKKK